MPRVSPERASRPAQETARKSLGALGGRQFRGGHSRLRPWKSRRREASGYGI